MRPQEAAHSRGQSLVELALTLPLLLVILFGTIDLGRLFFAYVTITNASREGARYGMTNLDTAVQKAQQDTNPTQKLQTMFQENTLTASPNVLNASTVTTECAPYNLSQTYSSAYCPLAQKGDRIRVTVTYNFQFVTLYLFGISNMTISSYTVMVIV
jgi:Flp pilus assembly protein TadG